MRPFLVALAVGAIALLNPTAVEARGSGGHHTSSSKSESTPRSSAPTKSTYRAAPAPKSYTAAPRAYSAPKAVAPRSTRPATAPKLSHSPAPRASTPRAVVGSRAAPGVQRNADGRIARSTAAKDHFQHDHPCPSTGRASGPCPGYVIDHIKALKHGGADDPSNMQWQTIAAAKEKDKIE